MIEMTPAPKSRELLAMIVALCTAVAVIVLAIDMQIKKDLIRIGNKAHDDLLLVRAMLAKIEGGHLVQEPERVPQRSDIRDGANGTVPGPTVGVPPAEVEGLAPAVASKRPVRKAAPRANPARTKRSGSSDDSSVPARSE